MCMSLLHLWDCYCNPALIRVDGYLKCVFNGSSELHINYNLIYIQLYIQLY